MATKGFAKKPSAGKTPRGFGSTQSDVKNKMPGGKSYKVPKYHAPKMRGCGK